MDPRTAHFDDLRVDDVSPENLRERPIDQFVDGLYCDRCQKAFVPDDKLHETRKRYHSECS